MNRVLPASILVLLSCVGIAAGDDSFDRAATILEANCLRCHNDQSRKGGLSLTTRGKLLKGGDSGPVIEIGKPGESLLIDTITGEKPLMPKQTPPLAVDEIQSIAHWIERGLPWKEGRILASNQPDQGPWWAVQPLKAPPSPSVTDSTWPRTPIDRFILATLESKHLKPSPEADRRTLIRRLSFDLTGLPPTAEQIAQFELDTAPDAYERLVDRLLASPRYGERWARHWLDVVHYGDTHGYDKDKRRDHAWPYRDYVINAFNHDKPYSQFVREQLAGDVIWPERPEAIIATGFIAAGPWDFVGHVELGEDTIEKEKTRVLDRDDMVANTMSTFTSLTAHCARCHDHKFDPIPQREYYRLQAVFAGVDRGNRTYSSPESATEKARLLADLATATRRLETLRAEVAALTSPRLAALEQRRNQLSAALASKPKPVSSVASTTNGYHSAIATRADTPAWVEVDLGSVFSIDEIRIHPARPTDFPDTPGFGFPPQFRVEARSKNDEAAPRVLLDFEQSDGVPWPDEPLILRPNILSARFVRIAATELWKRTDDYVMAFSELEIISSGKNVAQGAAVVAQDAIEAGRWAKSALVDGFDSRFQRSSSAELEGTRNDLLFELQEASRELSRERDALRSPALKAKWDEATQALARAESALKALPEGEVVYAVNAREPSPIHLLNRGEVEHPGALVDPGSLTCIPELTHDFSSAVNEGERRAALAEWIADRRNGLTWRSIANRVWQYHFGRGLVDTANDFGQNGAAPSHPELLDWLATELQNQNGSLKSLHRAILLSATYRQTSTHDDASALIDAENRFLWRQNRRRLEAEEIRDAVLATSGALDSRMFGPGFEVFRFKDDHSPVYDHEDTNAVVRSQGHRRAVYRFIVRSVPNPWIDCMDGADPNTSVPARNATITALQSLALLNDPFMLDQADRFARSLENEAESDRVRLAFARAIGRDPTPDELERLSTFQRRHGFTKTCRLLFNLNEFVFVD